MNIKDVLNSLESVKKTIIKDKSRALTGIELVNEVNNCSAILNNSGIVNGVPILLNMSNDVDSVITLLSAWNNGAVIFINNPFSPISSIKMRLENFKLHAFIGSNVLVRTLTHDSSSQSLSSSQAIKINKLSMLKKSPEECEKLTVLDGASVAIFSSGSTGEPKAILNSFEHIYENALSHNKAIGLHENDVVGCALPLYYSYGLVANLLSGLIAKAKISLTNLNTTFDQSWFENDQITVIALTPYYAREVVIEGSSLRVMTLGGDALTIKDANRIRENHPDCELYTTYGLTEAGPRVATWRFDNCELPKAKTAPLGLALNCCDYELRNAELWTDKKGGRKRGELVIKTKTRMLGYFQNSQCSIPSHWQENEVNTGDIFEEVDGDYFFFARDKEIIVQNGEKIFPANIEATLLTIDGVIDARVIGQPDNEKGEIAEALVHAKDGMELAFIRQSLLASLPRASMPTNIHLVNSIERTATGKKANKESFKYSQNQLSA